MERLFFGFPFSVLMHTMLPLAANEVVQPPGKRLIDIFIIIVAVIELGLFSTPLLMHYSRETHAIIFGPIFPFVGAIQIMFIGYSIGIVFFRRAFIKNGQVRKYILMIIAVIVIFFPAIAYDQFYFSGVASIDKVPIAIILSPLFYMALSLVTLVFGVKILISSVRATGKVTLQTEDLAKLAKEFGLTEREKNIIPLMVSGYGNKQIALELNLSVKTVGNHIYNMYRKLGISSRYELLALLT